MRLLDEVGGVVRERTQQLFSRRVEVASQFDDRIATESGGDHLQGHRARLVAIRHIRARTQ